MTGEAFVLGLLALLTILVSVVARTAQSLAELTRHLDPAADGDPETPPGRS